MGAGRRPVSVLLAAALVAWSVTAVETASALAATTPTRAGIFSISPPIHELRAEPGAVLAPTVIGNTSPQRLSVRVIPVLVHQTRSGSFRYSIGRAALRTARRVLAVSTSGFILGPGSQHSVLERWRPGAGHRHAWAGVIFRAAASVPGRSDAALHTVDQLLGLDLMDLRGDAPARGQLPRPAVSDAPPHRLVLRLPVRNAGGSVGTPSALRILVRDGTGRVVARLAPLAGIILPGVTRDFTIETGRRLAAGAYTARATARLHGRLRSPALRFRLAPDGLLLAPSLVAGAVSASGPAGSPASVRISVHNQGTQAGSPGGTVSLYALHGTTASSTPAARVALSGPPVAPGRSARERITLGRLRREAYRVIVTYAPPFVATNPAQVDFTARPVTPIWQTAWRWIRDHGAVLALALAAAGLAGFAGFAGRRGRRGPARTTGIQLRPLP